MVQLIRFTDINGDGFLDVEALYAQGASNVFCTYFLFDPAGQRFHYAAVLGILANAAYDADRQTILSQISDGVLHREYALFGFANGQPVALGTADIEELDEEQGCTIQCSVTAADDTVLLDTTTAYDVCDSTAWNTQYETLMQVLLNLSQDADN